LQPWWQVDLGGLYDISALEIWNRTDAGNQDRLDDFYVFVSDRPFSSTSPLVTQGQDGVWSRHVEMKDGPRPSVLLGAGTMGRYVRVELADTNFLTLAEVKVFGQAVVLGTNVAQGKTASQSSTYVGAVAARAVDGNTNGAWSGNSLSCTSNQLQPWWQVDLGGLYDISALEIWNRTDAGNQDRLDDFYVFVSDRPFTSTNPLVTQGQDGVWSRHVEMKDGPRPSVLLGAGAIGRYVRIQLADTNLLTLAEVKVFGQAVVLGTNVAQGKTASQSSTYEKAVAARAADGNTNGAWSGNSLSCTSNQLQPWWQVDLGGLYDISALEIWNRTEGNQDRLDDFYVFVSDRPFSSTSPLVTQGQDGVWSRHIQMKDGPRPSVLLGAGAIGRYVRIQLADTNLLTLAEVKVFGKPLLS